MSNDLEYQITKLGDDVKSALKQAYIDGFSAGSASDKPTQEEFNAAHKEPVGYGEDGELFVLSAEYDELNALAKLTNYFKKEMLDYEDILDGLRMTSVAYMPEDITDEPGYYVRSDRSGAYEAWVWRA